MPTNLFDIAPEDQSIYFLGQIFGNVGGVLTSSGSTISFLGMIFQSINTVALTVGAIIVVYTTVVGLLATAHEGEFLGKKWSGLWVPIRMVLGIGCLFPAASGYSAIQVIIMWIIVQGIGAADTVWTSAINYTAVAGSPYAGVSPSSIGVNAPLQSLFQGLVCQQSAALSAKNKDVVKYYIDSKNKGYAPKDYTPISYPMGPAGSCGILETCDKAAVCKKEGNDSVACWACTAQQEVMPEIIATLNGIAAAFVQYDTEYVEFHDTPGAKAASGGWIEKYCKSLDPPLDEKHCCVMDPLMSSFTGSGTCKPDAFYPSFQAKTEFAGSDIGEDGMKFYQTWAMYPLLTSKDAPVTTVDANADFIAVLTEYYVNSISSYVTAQITKLPAESLAEWQADAKKYGWITAGAYYYKMAKMSGSNMSAINQKLNIDTSNLPGADIKPYRNNFNGVKLLLQNLSKASQTSTSMGPAPPAAQAELNDTLDRANSEILKGFMENLTGTKSNEFVSMAAFGQNMLITAQLLYATILVATTATAIAIALTTSWMTLGTSWVATPPLEGLKAFLGIFTPIVFALLGALFTFGALLGMYIPLIPYVVFTVTAIGWFIATIEAMVAAPFVALGILSPGGQSEVFGRAEPAVLIILNLFLRPTLMVFGLMAAMLLAIVVLKFINMGFARVMGDVMNLHPGAVEQFIFIALYVSLIFTAMNKVFTLVHLIPERVLTYIGGHAIQYGEAEAAAGVKHGVEAAAAGAVMGMKGGTEGGIAGAGALGKALTKPKDQAVGLQSDAGGGGGAGTGGASGPPAPRPP